MRPLIVDLTGYSRYIHRRLESILNDWRANGESEHLLIARLCELGLAELDARLIAYQALKV